ncbi:MAG: hypothetical protein MUF87_05290 [Anaerolineae bacterium]|jgi:hypothetical protein|nr:hypothetical protein [Anaerolineae bacterium]
MSRLKSTPELLKAILDRVPEGMIHKSTLGQKLMDIVPGDGIAQLDYFFYDTARLTPTEAHQYSYWCHAILPHMSGKTGEFQEAPIEERRRLRDEKLQSWPEAESAMRVFAHLEQLIGYTTQEELAQIAEDERVIFKLLEFKMLHKQDRLLYDPLRWSAKTIMAMHRYHELQPLIYQTDQVLSNAPGQTVRKSELYALMGEVFDRVIGFGHYGQVDVPITNQVSETWVYPKSANLAEVLAIAHEESKITDESWQPCLSQAGVVLRPDARDGQTYEAQVLARSYTLKAAAKRLSLHYEALEMAIDRKVIPAFLDPEKALRVPASIVETAFDHPDYAEKLTAYQPIKVRDLAITCGVALTVMKRRLSRSKLDEGEALWGEVRGRWELPDSYYEFLELYGLKKAEWLEKREQERAERKRAIEEQREQERIEREQERKRRNELRAKLVAAFPSWRHEGRVDQRVILHVGPPNSGKTHNALEALAQAGSGWYLAPLRLLAFEIFDRLNIRGVPCNLLTGEERIDIPGATITSATVEMFNSERSGDCVIIDESQMLADSDRGWAWTRAMMEAQAPEIHMIAPPTTGDLIERLANAAAIPIEMIEHQRLAPIEIAPKPWSLKQLPPRTILIAFSRQTVLYLKDELEKAKRRVSVIYGNLPPEVRRRQADRFAEGVSEICIATDAVGMGLNLPADYVCFFEIEKFDGQSLRQLTSSEVQQIGGRAGRYGLSQAGMIGALNKYNLNTIRQLYYSPPNQLTHARVAPTVEDLEMLPGHLAEKLNQWAQLQSIPDSLRGVIKTVNLAERIELSKMLSDQEIEKLGLAVAVRLTNAPTRESNRHYWRACASAILGNHQMPLPPEPPIKITHLAGLEETEYCVSCADVYLWLANRHEFEPFGAYSDDVREMRVQWSMNIDQALSSQIDIRRRCIECGRILPPNYRHKKCDSCYYSQWEDDGA